MTRNLKTLFAALVTAAGLVACSDSASFTLYRNSVLDENMRIHVATFDASTGGEAYNGGNCLLAQSLFQAQPGVKTRFWCEKGRFRQ